MTTIEMPTTGLEASRSIAATQARRSAAQRVIVEDPATVARAAKVALVSAIASVPPITVLHMIATGPVEPTTWTISDYVVTLPYGTPLFGMTTGALAIAAFALVRGLVAISGPRAVRVLLAVWAAAMLGLSIFPTNLRGTPENVSSNVHLIAGAVVFALLPVAGWLLARWHRNTLGPTSMTNALRALSVLSGTLSTALIVNRMPGVIGLPELMLPPGILQRADGALEIVLLAAVAAAVLRSARHSR